MIRDLCITLVLMHSWLAIAQLNEVRDTQNNLSAYARQLAMHYNYEAPFAEKIVIKPMSIVSRSINGHQNSLVSPLSKSVYVHEEWLNALPEEQKRFVIGRCLLMLANPFKYTTGPMLTSLVSKIAEVASTTYGSDFLFSPEFNQFLNHGTIESKEFGIRLGVNAGYWLSKLLEITTHKSANAELDIKTVEKFNCAQGAMILLMGLRKCEHDKNILGKLCSLASPFTYATIHKTIRPGYTWMKKTFDSTPLENQLANQCQSEVSDNKLTELIGFGLHKALLFLTSDRYGKLHNTGNKLDYTIYNLPIINLCNIFNSPENRIAAIKQIKIKHLKTT